MCRVGLASWCVLVRSGLGCSRARSGRPSAGHDAPAAAGVSRPCDPPRRACYPPWCATQWSASPTLRTPSHPSGLIPMLLTYPEPGTTVHTWHASWHGVAPTAGSQICLLDILCLFTGGPPAAAPRPGGPPPPFFPGGPPRPGGPPPGAMPPGSRPPMQGGPPPPFFQGGPPRPGMMPPPGVRILASCRTLLKTTILRQLPHFTVSRLCASWLRGCSV